MYQNAKNFLVRADVPSTVRGEQRVFVCSSSAEGRQRDEWEARGGEARIGRVASV